MVMTMATIAKSNIISFGSILSLYVAYRAAWDGGVFDFLYGFVFYTFALPDLIDACFLIFLGTVLLSGLVFGLFSFNEVIEKGRAVLEAGNIDEDRLLAPARKEIDKILSKGTTTLDQGAAQYSQILEQAKTAGVYSLRLNLKRMKIDKSYRSAVLNSILWAVLSIVTVLCLDLLTEEAAPIAELWAQFIGLFGGEYTPVKSALIAVEGVAFVSASFFAFRSVAFLAINPIKAKSAPPPAAKVLPINRAKRFAAALQNSDFKIKFSQTYRTLIVVVAVIIGVYYALPGFFVGLTEIYPALSSIGDGNLSTAQIWAIVVEILAIFVAVYLAVRLIRQYFTPEKFSVFAIHDAPAHETPEVRHVSSEDLPSAELVFKTVIAKYRPKTTVAAFKKAKKGDVVPIKLSRARQLSPKNLLSFTDGGKVLFFLAVAIMLFGGYFLNEIKPIDLTYPLYQRFLTFSFIAGVCGALALLTDREFLHSIFLSISPMIGVFVAVLLWYGKSAPLFIAEALLTHAIHFMLLVYYSAVRKTVDPRSILMSGIAWVLYSAALFYFIPEFKMIYIFGLLPTLLITMASVGVMAAVMYFVHLPKTGGIAK